MTKQLNIRRFFTILMFIMLSYVLILPVRAEEGELVTGQSTIINGSFENPDLITENTGKDWNNTDATNVDGWKTTATDNLIEFGWMLDGKSSHMVPTVEVELIGSGAVDGYQFSEVVSSDVSCLYQSLSLSAGYYYNWTIHHRGRTGTDTMALIITDDSHIDYVKKDKTDIDHFNQIINWLKTQEDVAVPSDGQTADYNVYTTKLNDDLTFEEASSGSSFSFTKDEEHTKLFEIKLITTSESTWGEYTGTYLSETNKDILFVLAAFASSYQKDPTTAGNLIDDCSFMDSQGNNLLVNGGFEDVKITTSYSYLKSANSPSPKEGIGWCTTSIEYNIEVGNIEKGNAYGMDVIRNETIYNAPSIRDGSQFVELNANQESSLYQVVSTESGKMYRWSLSHRGRSGVDTMALIIGPEQPYLPLKKASNSRDQMMQIVDWIKNQTDVAWDIPDEGCSEKITIYTPKFNSTGGFELSSNIFTLQKDEQHTEEWSVWIISSRNDEWHDYGEIDASATYNYEYIVPEGNESSIFGFVSVKSSNTNNSYGNLLDNISFKEYYYIDIVNATNGDGSEITIKNDDDSFISDDETKNSGWALAGSSFSIHLKPGVRKIVGTYINGVFFSIDAWTYDSENNEYIYHIENTSQSVKIDIIYVANTVVYDSRSDYEYQYDESIPGSGCEFELNHDNQEYVSHAPRGGEGWYFVGWKYISPSDNQVYMFDAVHKIVFKENGGNGNETFEIHRKLDDNTYEPVVTGISSASGVTMFAEWKYEQRAVSNTYNQTTSLYDISVEGGIVLLNINSGDATTKTDYIYNDVVVGEKLYASEGSYINVTANNTIGYKFGGWYDSEGTLISNSMSYTYRVGSGKVTYLTARFELNGFNITITCAIENSTDLTKYFAIICTFTNLRANKVYTLSGLNTNSIVINDVTVTNPTRIKADENGNASTTLYMKPGDTATYLYIPYNAVYSVTSPGYETEGYTVSGEVNSLVLTNNASVNLKYYSVLQTLYITTGKHYAGVLSGLNPDVIALTSTSSYTVDYTTYYNPSVYSNLLVSFSFFDVDGNPKAFASGTRILMIDFTNASSPKYYSYVVTGNTTFALKLDETFTELVTNSPYERIIPSDSTIAEHLVFIVDYVGTDSPAESGRVALVYDDESNSLNKAINPIKKYVNVLEDNTELKVTNNSAENYASEGPLTMNISISTSVFTVNTLYEDGLYLVKLSTDDGFPDGTYASINDVKYFSNEGIILISPLVCGDYTANIYFPVPIELTLGKVIVNATLAPVVTMIAENTRVHSVDVEYNCIDVSASAIDAEIIDNALSEGSVTTCTASIKHENIDSISITIKQKNNDGTFTLVQDNIIVDLPVDDSPITVYLGNGFFSTAGETYIFEFVGYINDVVACKDTCVAVVGYITN